MSLHLTLSGIHSRSDTGCPEKDIMITVMIHALRGYESDSIVERKENRSWVEKMSGTFSLCAWALNVEPKIAQSYLLNKFDEIDEKRNNE